VSTPVTGRASLPRPLLILLVIAAATITAGGMKAISGFLAPTILALVLMITVYPIRTWLERKGVPAWLSALATILTVYLIVITMIVALIVSVAKLAQLVTQYTPQLNDITTDFGNWLKSLGVDQQQIDSVTSQMDFGKIFNLATSILSGTLGVLSDIIFLGVLTIFIAFDAGKFPAILASTGPEHSRVADSLSTFSRGTRTYFAVSAVFGLIVAVIDTIALELMGIPGAFVWGVLAFITNFIPNIGFIIGLVPPALLALLEGGVWEMIAVIVVYCAINFVIQSVIQPKFQADALNLSVTLTFLSLVFWTFVLGPLGALLALPMTMFVRAVFVDADPQVQWVAPLISGSLPPDDPPDEPPDEPSAAPRREPADEDA
jgi:predicted PurR-regulated permease PerM